MRVVTPVRIMFAAAGLGLPVSHALPSTGDNLGLWFCGAQPDRQAFDLITSTSPYPNLLEHVVVQGTETANPPLVWDIAGPSNASGTNVHVWGSYVPIHVNQQWKLVTVTEAAADGTVQIVQIVSLYNAMCLGATGPYVGASGVMQICNASDPLQQWTYNSANGTFSLPAAASGICLQAGNTNPSCDIAPFNGYPYCNASLSTAQRVADLLSRMSVQEKTAALDSGIPAIPRLGVPSMHSGEALHGAATGCLSNPANGSTGCPSSFPCPMALGAAFDTRLWEDVGLAIGLEARALTNAGVGALWLFAPNVNPARDPRWGRAQEVPSEDPTLVSSYAQSFVSGLQGVNGPDPRYLLAASTAKHFIAYDLEGFMPRTDVQPRPASAVCDTPGGCQRWNFDAFPPDRDLNGYFLPPFQSAVQTGVRSIMCSYNAINGQPACASPLLQAQFRGAVGWDGHVVSDCTAIELMGDSKWDSCAPPYPPTSCAPSYFPGHNYSFTVAETVNAALGAGTDINCGPMYKMWLDGLVINGSVAMDAVDTAVARVYTTAVKLGLLDPSAGQVYPQLPPSTVDSADHRALALRAAQESIVLLKNDAATTQPAAAPAPLLPLVNGGKGLKVAFIGPHANSTQALLSNYHGTNTLVDSHSPLAAALARGLEVTYLWGCNICDVVPPGFPNMPCPTNSANDTSGIAPAAQAAAAADVAVVFVGSDQTTEAENFDRSDITLAGVQEQLVRAVVAAQPNTVVVFISGGPVSSPWIAVNVPSIVQSFYPGELGGDAIVDVLTGAFNPSGRLPVTMYYPNITARDMRNVDLADDGGITHLYFKGPVLWPFGWGLSYTTFRYDVTGLGFHSTLAAAFNDGGDGLFKLSAQGLTALLSSSSDERTGAEPWMLSVNVTVTNTGAMAGDHTLLAFVTRDDDEEEDNEVADGSVRSQAQPRQMLLGFVKVRGVGAGASQQVQLQLLPHGDDASRSIARSAFGLYRGDGGAPQWAATPGRFLLRIGDVHVARLQVT